MHVFIEFNVNYASSKEKSNKTALATFQSSASPPLSNEDPTTPTLALYTKLLEQQAYIRGHFSPHNVRRDHRQFQLTRRSHGS
jgi:hypothetical protein